MRAAAVKRRERALSGIIGRKEFVGGFYRLKKKVLGYTEQFLQYASSRVLHRIIEFYV